MQPLPLPVIGIDETRPKNLKQPSHFKTRWTWGYLATCTFCGAFQWLREQKKEYTPNMRQLNNPLAGLDSTLSALTGFAVFALKKYLVLHPFHEKRVLKRG